MEKLFENELLEDLYEARGEELKKLEHSDISMYSNYLFRHKVSATTINRKLAAIKQYNLFLIAEELQKDIVILDRDYYKMQNSIISKTLPTENEINKLLHNVSRDSKRDFCVVVLLVYGGFREHEIVSLRLIDIRLEERFINVIGKGHKLRQIVINNIMYDALKEYLLERNQLETENQYLFIGKKNINNNNPLNRNFCNRLLDKYKKLLNIKNLHPHLLRAYFCTNSLHNAGYTIDQVANQAGHSSLNTTKKYLVSNKENLLNLSNKL